MSLFKKKLYSITLDSSANILSTLQSVSMTINSISGALYRSK